MSTELIKQTLDGLKDDLVEYINDECLDVLDVMEAETLAVQVIKIAQRITFFMKDRPQMSVHGVIGEPKSSYIWNIKVHNIKGGWVSCSDDTQTAVSNTMYYPFFKDDEDGWFAGLTSLTSMINEAWYHCYYPIH